MSAFLWSQILIAIAIVFDLISFQFKKRQKIVCCLCASGILISTHFVLLEQWTAASLMLLASIRYFTSIFTTSKRWMFLYLTSALMITVMTFVDLIICLVLAERYFRPQLHFVKVINVCGN